jgi:hypothetical protein
MIVNKQIVFKREWAMPNSNTFSIGPVLDFIHRHISDGLWIDPFANSNKIAKITNDLDPQYNTDYHLDAFDFLKQFPDSFIDGVLFDPPYSSRQVAECYKKMGMTVNMTTTQGSFWAKLKSEISRIIKPNGKCLSFGWNSGGIGEKYGFDIQEIVLVPHGGVHYDTICVAETRRITLFENVVS